MKTEKKPWERGLTITVIILLAVSVLISAGICFWVELYADVRAGNSNYVWGLCISAGTLLLVCVFFLRRSYSHPFALSLCALIITFAMFISSVCFFQIDFYCLVENPNYETEYAEWVSGEGDQTAADSSSSDSALERARRRRYYAQPPEKYIRAQTNTSRFADSVCIVCGIFSGICALLFFIYFFFWLPRFFVPLQHKRNQTKAIKKREKAFAQIEKFHEYRERGIMTEEEYQESRQRILDSID